MSSAGVFHLHQYLPHPKLIINHVVFIREEKRRSIFSLCCVWLSAISESFSP